MVKTLKINEQEQDENDRSESEMTQEENKMNCQIMECAS